MKWDSRDYDEVISRLAKKEAGTPQSLFGACKGSKSFKRELEVEHELIVST